MDSIATIFAVGLALYVAAGLVTGLAFVVVRRDNGAKRAGHGGRAILLLPGGDRLWPLVLSRWLQSRRPR